VSWSGDELLHLPWKRRFRLSAQDPAFILFHLKVENAAGEDNCIVDASLAPLSAYPDTFAYS
jgi:hypothetical protein